jgi:hypothetical protein
MLKKIELISKVFYYSFKSKVNPQIDPIPTYIGSAEAINIMIFYDPVDFWKHYLIKYRRFKDEESVVGGDA